MAVQIWLFDFLFSSLSSSFPILLPFSADFPISLIFNSIVRWHELVLDVSPDFVEFLLHWSKDTQKKREGICTKWRMHLITLDLHLSTSKEDVEWVTFCPSMSVSHFSWLTAAPPQYYIFSFSISLLRQIPNDFLADSCSGLVLEQANCENLTVWLTSLGLPMYHQHLVTNGWNNLQTVSRMKESDLLSVGILDKRHLRTMIRAISALNVTIQKISSCYEHNYESIPPPVSSTSPNQSTA